VHKVAYHTDNCELFESQLLLVFSFSSIVFMRVGMPRFEVVVDYFLD
jgi:hypothetical protein